MKKDWCLSELLSSTGLLLIKSFRSLMQSLKLFVSLGHAKTFLNLLLENVSKSIRKNISMMI